MPDNQKNTLMCVAYQRILQKIIQERITPGTPLRELHLAHEFNLSPTPVREAFRRLENEGWLERLPFCGCVLRKYSLDELEDLFNLRENIECTLVRSAVKRATAKDFQAFEEALAAEQEYINVQTSADAIGNTLSPTDHDIAIHDALRHAAHTPSLSQHSENIHTRINYMILLNSRTPALPTDLQAVHEEHCMIFSAIRRRWSEIAEALVKKHIQLGRDKYLALLKSSENA